jgi:hypothetical protein
MILLGQNGVMGQNGSLPILTVRGAKDFATHPANVTSPIDSRLIKPHPTPAPHTGFNRLKLLSTNYFAENVKKRNIS